MVLIGEGEAAKITSSGAGCQQGHKLSMTLVLGGLGG